MEREEFIEYSQMIKGEKKAPLVIKNIGVLNVFTEEIEVKDVAIADGLILGLGKYNGVTNIDGTGKYMVPGFVDSHLHLESTLVNPSDLVYEASKHGTLTFVVDPHEAANVCGIKGVNYILDETQNVMADVFVMAPSCVPAIKGEDNGHTLLARELAELLKNPRILGLGEVMDAPAVIQGDKDMYDKLQLFNGRVKDGHAPFLFDEDLTAYSFAGIGTDHECSQYDYAKKEVERGMYVLIREGSGAKNLEAIVRGMVKHNAPTDRYCFCTDDKHIAEIMEKGHISYNIRRSIELGIDPIKAYKMATINPCNCYGLKGHGAIAPGYNANFVILHNLENVEIDSVYYKGEIIKKVDRIDKELDDELINSVKVRDFNREKLKLPVKNPMDIIEIISGELLTSHIKEEVPYDAKNFLTNCIYNKVAVLERHHNTGKVGVGIVKGFGIKDGALASSVAHDSHNIVVIGDNDDDIMVAVQEIIRNQGGFAIVSKGEVLESLQLEVMGLMTNRDHHEVDEITKKIIERAYELGVNRNIDPLINLSFLALPVIPEIRITTNGYVIL